MGKSSKKVTIADDSKESVNQVKPQTEAELKCLPDWPIFYLQQVARDAREHAKPMHADHILTKEDYDEAEERGVLEVTTDILWVASTSKYSWHVCHARRLVESCKYLKEDDDDFVKLKRRWGYHYRQIFILRKLIADYFGFRLPNFAIGFNEVKPDRYICGVPLACEDFEKVFGRKPEPSSRFFARSDDPMKDSQADDIDIGYERQALLDVGMIKIVEKTEEEMDAELKAKDDRIEQIATEVLEAADALDMTMKEKVDAYVDQLAKNDLI